MTKYLRQWFITYDSFLPMFLRNFSNNVDLIRLQSNGLVDCDVFARTICHTDIQQCL